MFKRSKILTNLNQFIVGELMILLLNQVLKSKNANIQFLFFLQIIKHFILVQKRAQAHLQVIKLYQSSVSFIANLCGPQICIHIILGI
jgi:hypothetical protein